MGKLKYNDNGTWKQIAPSMKEFQERTIEQSDIPPEGIVEGRLWLDTSDNTYQGTVFEELDQRVNNNATEIANVQQTVATHFAESATDEELGHVTLNQLIQENILINGNFDIWQRGIEKTNLSRSEFLADRWANVTDGDGTSVPDVITKRRALEPGELKNSKYCYRMEWNGDLTYIDPDARHMILQRVEKGTSLYAPYGKLTLSFWARSNIPNKKIGINAHQYYGTGGSPHDNLGGKSFVLTNLWQKFVYTWETKSLEGKQFGADDEHLEFQFYVMWGEGYKWRFDEESIETYRGAGFVEFAQIQVVPFEFELPFKVRSFAEELMLCQRYYEKSKKLDDSPIDMSYRGMWIPYEKGQTLVSTIPFKVKKRTTPNVTVHSVGRDLENHVLVGEYDQLPVDIQFEHEDYFAIKSTDTVGTSGYDFAKFDWEADAEIII